MSLNIKIVSNAIKGLMEDISPYASSHYKTADTVYNNGKYIPELGKTLSLLQDALKEVEKIETVVANVTSKHEDQLYAGTQ